MRRSFLVQEVGAGLRRNLTMTIAMILTTAISLGMFGAGLLSLHIANASKAKFLARVEVEVYLTDDAGLENPKATKLREDLGHKLQGIPGVVSVSYISKARAIEKAINQTFANSKELQGLVRTSRLPASLNVKVQHPDQLDGVMSALSPLPPGVEYVLDQRELVRKIFGVFDAVRNTVFVIASLQAIAAVLLIINTIQMAAFSRKTEVSIMGLVGATRWYRQLPFLLEALIASLIGSTFAVLGLILLKNFFLTRFIQSSSGLKNFIDYKISDVLLIAPEIYGAGAVLSLITAYFTLHFYVKE